MQRTSELAKIFDTNKLNFICDDEKLIARIKASNFSVNHISEMQDVLPEAVISISTSMDHFREIGRLISDSSNTQLLSIPQAVFDTSTKAALYSYDRLLESNFETALALQEKWREIISNSTKPLRFTAEKTDITCSLGDSVQLTILNEKKLVPGHFRSVAEFFEVSFDHVEKQNELCFCVNGSIQISGLLIAKSPHYESQNDALYKEAMQLLEEVADHKGSLIVADNQVVSFNVNGIEYVQKLEEFAGPLNKLNVTEFAIGLNKDITNTIDFKINSQINEGIHGIHLGLGDGTTGLHIDFLCPNAEYSN